MPTKRGVRLLLVALLVGSAVGLVDARMGSGRSDGVTAAGEANAPRSVEPRDGITVISTDSNVWLADRGTGPRQSSELLAYAADGSLLYHDDTHDRYWDVDPSPVGDATVVYTASDHLNGTACNATTVCTRNVIERVDLRTGEVTTLYSAITPYKHSTRWHDVDRLDDSHFVVADIYRDRVFVVDVETGMVEWAWNAQQAYDLDSGGPFPRDWTHLNDVEVLDDGRIMVSLRNQDQVVFVDRETGLLENWTLGSEDDYDVLHEQHNPDYIPERRGGPAVVVADSENNRVVEYQRKADSWTRSWVWQDARLQWPRDADRLPNGNTLIADSNGDRVLEVAPDGEVVWSVDVAFPYEVERLGTGAESAGGQSADALGLESRTVETRVETERAGFGTQVWTTLKQVVPGPLLNAVVYLTPGWVGPQAMGSIAGLVLFGGALCLLEWRWRGYSLTWHRPVDIERREP